MDPSAFQPSEIHYPPRKPGEGDISYAHRCRVVDAIHARQRRLEAEEAKVPGQGATKFTTDYCIEWGRKQGWKLLDRENYNHKTKRHHDLMLGADAMFEGPDELILVQGAGKGERVQHMRRYQERGGTPRAAKLNIQFFYVEFVRGNKAPISIERWA